MNRAHWAIQVLWGFFFAGSGFGKILLLDPVLYRRAPEAVAWYAAVPRELIVFIGVCEVLGGIGLILPAMTGVQPMLTPLVALGLTLIIFASMFHIARGKFALMAVTVALGVGIAFMLVGRLYVRPIAPASSGTGRAVQAIAVLGLIAITTFAPTWYNPDTSP
jgi:DoxX-like family